MKLDYLQFLELEVFTQFGARLEASMERAIRRGRVLRQILKQPRFSPSTERFELAWMIAFNDGLLDDIDAGRVVEVLGPLETALAASPLALDSPRDEWRAALARWLPAQAQSGSAHDETT